jgi:hypothetical protein
VDEAKVYMLWLDGRRGSWRGEPRRERQPCLSGGHRVHAGGTRIRAVVLRELVSLTRIATDAYVRAPSRSPWNVPSARSVVELARLL